MIIPCYMQKLIKHLIDIKADILKISSLPLKDDAILKKYKEVFEGTGCIKGDYHLGIKPNVQPIKQAPRRIPISLKLELKLDELCKNKIIAKITRPTDWINNLVLVQTPNKFRICLDQQNLNSTLKKA
ncbi:hypothetical protein AVEN_31903-1 [Araneus ventricosus]|uniref:Peptidase A9 domain-containing protein n=1 Tax=Araneus ventricosus TaxID=182803 RepID=A0A4Y2KID6_ARAVE|nr:hypothetical protein AVEN_31903-1 [Araneus ventricosus]